MITLEQARYLCHSDEPTATRDLIIAISEAEGVLDRENMVSSYEITPSTPAATDAHVLLDYLMGHMEKRNPTLFEFLRDWSWRSIESAFIHHPASLPFRDSGSRNARGMQTQVVFGVRVARGWFTGARMVTLEQINLALECWLSLYRLHFADHPAPSYGPLRRMVFLPFAVWPGVQHDRALARTILDPTHPSVQRPTPFYDLPLALADVARALPNASPQRPAPPLHVVSSGDAVMVLGKGMKPPHDLLGDALGPVLGPRGFTSDESMRPVRMLLYYQEQHWRIRYEIVSGLSRHNPLIAVWKTAIQMSEGLHDPNAPRYEANIMQHLWHSPESSPSAPPPLPQQDDDNDDTTP